MNETNLTSATWREQVPATVAAAADQWQSKITVAVNAAVMVAGQALRAMKAEMPHGCFEQWWREELKLKDRKTVSDLMSASELLEGQPETTPLVDLPARTLGILNRGGPEVVGQALKRLEKGERITEAVAKQIAKRGESPQMVEAKPAKADELAELRAQLERVKAFAHANHQEMDELLDAADADAERIAKLEADNAELRHQLEASRKAALSEADNHVKEGLAQQRKADEWLKSMPPDEQLETQTFMWFLTRKMSMDQTFPFIEQLMAEVTAAGAKHDDPGSMDPERWEKIYRLVNPFFDEVDHLAELEEALGLESAD